MSNMNKTGVGKFQKILSTMSNYVPNLDTNGDQYKSYFTRQGKTFVPVRPTANVFGNKNRRQLGGERKFDDWEIYNKAIMAEPMVFRSILLIAKYMTAFGYSFGYVRKFIRKLNKSC